MTERIRHIPTTEEVQRALAEISIKDMDLEAELAEVIPFPIKEEPDDLVA